MKSLTVMFTVKELSNLDDFAASIPHKITARDIPLLTRLTVMFGVKGLLRLGEGFAVCLKCDCDRPVLPDRLPFILELPLPVSLQGVESDFCVCLHSLHGGHASTDQKATRMTHLRALCVGALEADRALNVPPRPIRDEDPPCKRMGVVWIDDTEDPELTLRNGQVKQHE